LKQERQGSHLSEEGAQEKSSLLNAIFGYPVAKIGSVKAETVFGKWFNI